MATGKLSVTACQLILPLFKPSLSNHIVDISLSYIKDIILSQMSWFSGSYNLFMAFPLVPFPHSLRYRDRVVGVSAGIVFPTVLYSLDGE